MSLEQRLQEANYVKRDEDGSAVQEGGQCGLLPCDFSRIVEDERTGESFRYCDRLGIRVGEYDSCNYYSDTQMQNLIGQMSQLMQEEEQAKQRTVERKAQQKLKKIRTMIAIVIVCAGVFVYWYMTH